MKCEIEEFTEELLQEVYPTLDQHRQELQSYKDMKLNPDRFAYFTLQKSGRLKCFIIRDDDTKEIIGYSFYVINTNMHYSDFLYAIEDIFYVVPGKRGSRIGVKLVKESEKYLKDIGVDVITHHAKFTNNFAEFLEKLGYHKTEVMLAKRISD